MLVAGIFAGSFRSIVPLQLFSSNRTTDLGTGNMKINVECVGGLEVLPLVPRQSKGCCPTAMTSRNCLTTT